jgi:hypothetical protein
MREPYGWPPAGVAATRRHPDLAGISYPVPVTTTKVGRLAAALALGAALLAGCSSEGASTSCGVDRCTVTFDRGANGSVSVLGVDAKFVGADGDQVTLEVAGERVSLTVGQPAVQVGGLDVAVASVTDTEVAVQISRASS